MNEEIENLLEQIQTWMIDNDYECGEQGDEIYSKICEVLVKYAPKN